VQLPQPDQPPQLPIWWQTVPPVKHTLPQFVTVQVKVQV
jgi:hypothetical protein